MYTSVVKGSRKASRLGGAERGGMYRMEMPKFSLVGISQSNQFQNQDHKVYNFTHKVI